MSSFCLIFKCCWWTKRLISGLIPVLTLIILTLFLDVFHFQILEQFLIRTSAVRSLGKKKLKKIKKSVLKLSTNSSQSGLNCLEKCCVLCYVTDSKIRSVGLATRHLCSTFSDPLFNQPSTDHTVSPSLILHVTYFSVSQQELRFLSVSSRLKDLQRHLQQTLAARTP